MPLRDIWKGGYVLAEAGDGEPDLVLVATGSEVGLALDARDKLAAGGIRVRVVSMPCTSLFDQQPAAYQEAVLGRGPVAAVEAGKTDGWYRYTGRGGLVIGIDTFGASGPAGAVAEHFRLTAEQVAARIREHLGR